MSSLPTELWNQILYAACTDDGSTGQSLALVSLRFQELSKRSRLRSVSILGPTQLSNFAQMLVHTPSEELTTEYLFVSSDIMLQSTAITSTDGRQQQQEILFRRRLEGGDRPTDEEAKWLVMLVDVLGIISLSLQTLAIHGSIPRVDTLLPMCLSNLIELTVHTPIIRFLPDDDAYLPFHQLRRLKVAIYPVPPLSVIRRIRRLAPHLENLLLSVVENPSEVYDDLQEAFRTPDSDGLPWGIKEIRIQPSEPPGSLRKASTTRSWKKLSSLSKRGVVLLPMGTRWSVLEALHDWLVM